MFPTLFPCNKLFQGVQGGDQFEAASYEYNHILASKTTIMWPKSRFNLLLQRHAGESPFYLSGETPDHRQLAHRTAFEGIEILTNHRAGGVHPALRTVDWVFNNCHKWSPMKNRL